MGERHDATDGHDDDRGPSDPGSAADWDERYREVGGRLWSGEPNAALVAEVSDLPPGTALDVGCGEGADAIWLARRGWRVTAVDISQVALDRGRRAAAAAGVEVEWRQADLPADAIDGRFDLVSAQYPVLRHAPGDPGIRLLLDAVAPGGTLLVVHHDLDAGGHAHRHFDPSEYVRPDDVAAHLDGEHWEVVVHERRDRVRPEGSPGPDVPDVVLRARRRR